MAIFAVVAAADILGAGDAEAEAEEEEEEEAVVVVVVVAVCFLLAGLSLLTLVVNGEMVLMLDSDVWVMFSLTSVLPSLNRSETSLWCAGAAAALTAAVTAGCAALIALDDDGRGWK